MKNTRSLLYLSTGLALAMIVSFLLGMAVARDDTGDTSDAVSANGMLDPTPFQREDGAMPTFLAGPTAASGTQQQQAVVPLVDLADYTIAYLADASVTGDDSPFAAARLLGENAHTFNEMAELMAFHETEPLDVLAIHESAADRIDAAWVADLYRQSVVFVTVNVPMSQRAEWIDSDCARQIAAIQAAGETGNYAYSGYFYVLGESVVRTSAMLDYKVKEMCLEPGDMPPAPPDVNSPECEEVDCTIRAGGGSTTIDLDSETGAEDLQRAISKHLWSWENAQYTYANRHLPPTAVPGLSGVSG